MIIKQLIDEDFSNYKKTSMFIGFPTCSWKCEKECGQKVCQNSALSAAQSIDIPIDKIVERYIKNPITNAIVMGGLEPFESFDDLYELVMAFRKNTDDDIVLYTGFYDFEIQKFVDKLSKFHNIIIKFGRYIPDNERHFDDVLGIYLSSDNQYGKKIS